MAQGLQSAIELTEQLRLVRDALVAKLTADPPQTITPEDVARALAATERASQLSTFTSPAVRRRAMERFYEALGLVDDIKRPLLREADGAYARIIQADVQAATVDGITAALRPVARGIRRSNVDEVRDTLDFELLDKGVSTEGSNFLLSTVRKHFLDTDSATVRDALLRDARVDYAGSVFGRVVELYYQAYTNGGIAQPHEDNADEARFYADVRTLSFPVFTAASSDNAERNVLVKVPLLSMLRMIRYVTNGDWSRHVTQYVMAIRTAADDVAAKDAVENLIYTLNGRYADGGEPPEGDMSAQRTSLLEQRAALSVLFDPLRDNSDTPLGTRLLEQIDAQLGIFFRGENLGDLPALLRRVASAVSGDFLASFSLQSAPVGQDVRFPDIRTVLRYSLRLYGQFDEPSATSDLGRAELRDRFGEAAADAIVGGEDDGWLNTVDGSGRRYEYLWIVLAVVTRNVGPAPRAKLAAVKR